MLSIGHDEASRGGAAALVAEKEREIGTVENSGSNDARGLRRDFADPGGEKPSHPRRRPSVAKRHRAHVKYVAGLHGDEPSGRQLLVALAEYICAFDPKLAAAELAARRNSGGTTTTATTSSSSSPSPSRHADPRVAALLSRNVLHLAPAVNPDGFDLRRRENAAGVDLNRDFPDPLAAHGNVFVGRLFGNESSSSSSSTSSAPFVGSLPGRSPDPDADDVDLSPTGKEQPETLALMRWMTPPEMEGEGEEGGENSHLPRTRFRFVASAALHEGALVANYPWDGTPDDSTRYAACPDDATFRWLASSYAERSPAMVGGPEFGRGVARPTDDGLVVPKSSSQDEIINNNSNNNVPDAGTTNGAAWYPLRGGMQDWNYLQASCFELTLELAQSKWPRPALLPGMFAENLDPLLAFPVVASAGAHGVVLRGGGKKEEEEEAKAAKSTSSSSVSSSPPLLPPPAGTTVRVRGLRGAPPALPDPLTGAWFRPLNPGNYVLSVAAPGTQPVEAEIEVVGGGSKSGGSGSGSHKSGGGSGSKLVFDRSPDLEVTLREQGSTARLVEVSSVVVNIAAPGGGGGGGGGATAAAVAVPLAKSSTAFSSSSFLGGRKAAGGRLPPLSGDTAAVFGLQVALAVAAVAALVAVARRKAGGGGGAAPSVASSGASS